MSIKNTFNKLRSLPKRYTLAIATGLVIALPIIAQAGFGPNRPVFDWNNPDDRKGSLTGPVFNSFINTPTYGDERNFVRVADVVAGQSPVDANFSESKTATAGKEYWIRTFVHNNANQSTNDTIGVAKNTRVSVDIAEGTANGVDVLADITADNATPQKVWDTATLVNDNTAFSLSYVPGSAKIYNPAHVNGLAISDNIVSDNGTLIGFDAMNGDLPGCFEFSAYVYIKVKVTSPDLQIDKRVSKIAAPKLSETSETVTAKRGETITWRIDYKNTGSETARNITIRDQIPAGLTLVPGSITWIDVNHQSGETFQDTALGSGGVNVGNYAVNGNGVIRFQTTIDQDVEDCEITNVAFGRADNVAEQNDDAKVVIEDCDVPVFRCETLKATLVSGRTYKFIANATAEGGATVKQYRFNFGDGSAEAVTDKNVVEHTYKAGDDNFVARVAVDFNVDGDVETDDDSATCKTPINFGPTELPDTGAGSVLGMFAAVTAAGAIAHKFVLGRRFNS